MADTEKNEDQKISRCLQEAFGYTDEQLLKQLDQANETLKDVTFDGAEDRIMKKIMARKAELKKQTSAPEPETERNITLVKADTEDRKDKKIVRFGKKKVMATVALVAVIAGMLGGTAVGKKNYFFRKTCENVPTILVDNDKNKYSESKMEAMYEEIKEGLNITILKFGYLPEKMELDSYSVLKERAEIKFSYNKHIIIYHLFKNGKSSSLNYESDCDDKQIVYNKWLNKEIEYYMNQYESGETECEASIINGGVIYHFSGIIDEIEFKRILENLYFF